MSLAEFVFLVIGFQRFMLGFGVVFFIFFLSGVCCTYWVCGFIVFIKDERSSAMISLAPTHFRTPITHRLYHLLLSHRLKRLWSSFIVFCFLLCITDRIVSVVLATSPLLFYTMSSLWSPSNTFFILCILFVNSGISILFFFVAITFLPCYVHVTL